MFRLQSHSQPFARFIKGSRGLLLRKMAIVILFLLIPLVSVIDAISSEQKGFASSVPLVSSYNALPNLFNKVGPTMVTTKNQRFPPPPSKLTVPLTAATRTTPNVSGILSEHQINPQFPSNFSFFKSSTVKPVGNFLLRENLTNSATSEGELLESYESGETGIDYADKREDDEDEGDGDEEDEEDEESDGTSSVEEGIAASMKNPLNFQNLLGADFQPGRLINLFFGLIIMMTMMIFQGYAMWVFGIAFLPGTRSLDSNWTLDMEKLIGIVDALADALDHWESSPDEFRL